MLESVQRDAVPFLYNNKEIFLGKHVLRKENNAFVIYHNHEVVGHEPCYFLLESAMMVSFAVQHNSATLLSKIEKLDKEFSKHYFDCLHIHQVIKTARAEDDNYRADALIDKYNYAREKRDYHKKLIRSLCGQNIRKR